MKVTRTNRQQTKDNSNNDLSSQIYSSIEVGKVARFKDETKSKVNKDIWVAQISPNSKIIGNWRTGEKQTIDDGKSYSYQDETDFKREKAINELVLSMDYQITADFCDAAFKEMQLADYKHPYLLKKGIKPIGIKQYMNKLIVPIYSLGKYVPKNEIQSLQMIHSNGFKQFYKAGQSKGYMALSNGSTKLLVMCEGYATGVSIVEHLKANNIAATVVVAFNCHNLLDVGKYLRENYPLSIIEIWADNDLNGTGQAKANQVANIIGATVKIPPLTKEEQEKGLSDFNDYFNLKGNN